MTVVVNARRALSSSARVSLVAACVSAALVAATALPASASTGSIALPKPGSASHIALLVSESTSINSIPAHLDPAVSEVMSDTNGATKYRGLKTGCLTALARCTFGDTTGSKLVVLFGDSHAWMWTAAVAPEMSTEHARLQVLWQPGCPAATVEITPEIQSDTGCPAWRTSAIAIINHEHPSLVILSERTTDVTDPNSTTPLTAAQWTSGLETTIRDLTHTGTRVVVIGDVPGYETLWFPGACLSRFPTKLKSECQTTVKRSSAMWQSFGTAEAAAAAATKAGFVDPIPWLCYRNACSIVVGNMVVYSDWVHITATYAAYLSGVMGAKIKPFLAKG